MGQCLGAACKRRWCSGLPGQTTSTGPSTLDGIEIVRFCAFAPPGFAPRSEDILNPYCGTRDNLLKWIRDLAGAIERRRR
jgi:hypothetical protein